MDIAFILQLMIYKNVEPEKREELLEMINMKQHKNIMKTLVYSEYGDQLEEKDKEIEEKDQKIIEQENQITKQGKEIATLKQQLGK